MPTLEQLVRNPLKEKLRAGEVVTSMIVRISRGPETGRLAGTAGLDAIYVDLEHSPLTLETTAVICTSAWEAGVTPMVRVPGKDAGLIGRILDLGAMGVIAPQVDSADDARQAVSAALYPPAGRRSVSSTLPVLAYRNFPALEMTQQMNSQILIAVMIETEAGIRHCDEIAAVDGVDMLFIGAHDLSVDMGLAGQSDHPRLKASIHQVLQSAKRHGKAVGIGGMAANPQALQFWLTQGVQFISVGSDLGFLLQGATQSVARVRDMQTNTNP